MGHPNASQSHHHLLPPTAVFEIAVNEISARQSRCYHVVQLLTAIVSLMTGVVFALVLVFHWLWLDPPAPLFISGRTVTLGVTVLVTSRILRRRLGLESDTTMCDRLNHTLASCGLDLAYDVYSGRLYSKEKRARRSGHGGAFRVDDLSAT